ncbi:MAG: aminoglycoside phosphotransferase family protein [Chloroflexota bacterium]|nr:aminoglycoside phosphotransferase family protein [Chloroflexota bacterium]
MRHFRAAGLEEEWFSRELRRRGVPYVATAARRLGLGALASRLFSRLGVLSGGDLDDARTPPRYVRAIAAADGVDLEGHRWGLSAKGHYASQKALFFLYRGHETQPDVVVKVSQDPSRSHLLENAYLGLRRLEATEFGAAGRLPRPRFQGIIRGLALTGEEAVEGTAFVRRSPGGPACPYADDAVAALIELGRNSVGRCPSAQVAEVLAEFLEQFLALYRPSSDAGQHLQGQIEALSAAGLDIPLVFMHGDPGLQNLVIRSDGRLSLLDWENAEPAGMPLWDLFHFLRAYVVWAGRQRGLASRSWAIKEHYLEGSGLTDLLIASVERYRHELDLDSALVAPLFWTHLLVQALREAPRLDASGLHQGHQLKVLELIVAQRHSGVLGRILQQRS